MLALGVDGIRSHEDHEAFLEIEKAVPILARHASFLGRCLLALSFFRSIGLSQKALEEFTVLVEVLDGVGVVGAWTLHELCQSGRAGPTGAAYPHDQLQRPRKEARQARMMTTAQVVC